MASLPSRFTELMPGLRARKGSNGYATVLLHFSADPDGRTAEQRQMGLTKSAYLREHCLDFTSRAGKPVFGEDYDPSVHEDPTVFYNPQLPLWVGLDFGYHHPAASFHQLHGDGGWWILGELMGEDKSLPRFLEEDFLPYLNTNFPAEGPKKRIVIYGADPAGKQVSDKSEHTSFTICQNYGIYPLSKKSPIDEGLTLIRQGLRRTVEGKPGLKIHPDRCPVLCEAFQGGLVYEEQKPGRPDKETPKKDGYYEHLVDTVRYKAVNSQTLYTAKPKAEVHEPGEVGKFLETQRKPKRTADNDYGVWG